MVFPLGLPIPRFNTHTMYQFGIMRWRDHLYIHPTNHVCRDICYYHTMLTQLVLNNVRFKPYHFYLAWDELEAKLTRIK